MAEHTLDDLADSLPNGFHDALLKAVAIDYVAQKVTLSLDIWIAVLEAVTEEEREAYRPATVSLSGVVYFVNEAPDSRYDYHDDAGSLRVNVGRMEELTRPPSINLPAVPETAFANWIYVSEWNALIYLAARDAHFEWCGPSDQT